MADTNETIADIIAWLRRPRDGENAYLTLWRDEIADRFDAAHKREREAITPKPDPDWKDICAKCMEGDIEPHHCEYYGEQNGCNSPTCGEHPPTPNAAAMYSCLLKILAEMIDLGGMEVGRKARFSPDAIAEEIRQAFAVPPRNCDRFANAEEAWDAYDEWADSYRSQGKTEPFNEVGWLFAPATEKEGGANG